MDFTSRERTRSFAGSNDLDPTTGGWVIQSDQVHRTPANDDRPSPASLRSCQSGAPAISCGILECATFLRGSWSARP